jgi:serine/threonine protein kinase
MSPAADTDTIGALRTTNTEEKMCTPLSESVLRESMKELADGVRPVERGSFTMVRRLQSASRNHGRVDAMSYQGHHVAVKRMPNWWVQDDHAAFHKKYRFELERPWVDFGIVAELQRAHYPYTCEMIGIFRDDNCTYVVSSLATRGDLFAWAQTAPAPGPVREAAMRPLVVQVLDAVRLLHELGVSHRDISLENVLLTGQDAEEEEATPQVRLIDFGMAALGRRHGGPGARNPGKPFYKAPELHYGTSYDGFLADAYSVGIIVYALTLASYPWESTKPGDSAAFERASEVGTTEFLSRRSLRGTPLPEVLSPELLELIGGLAAIKANDRLTLGEACFSKEERASALESPWLPTTSAPETTVPVESCQAGLCNAPSATSLSTMADKDDSDGEDSCVMTPVATATTAEHECCP